MCADNPPTHSRENMSQQPTEPQGPIAPTHWEELQTILGGPTFAMCQGNTKQFISSLLTHARGLMRKTAQQMEALKNMVLKRGHTNGCVKISEERFRQIANEGFTDAMDDAYASGELQVAALGYLLLKYSAEHSAQPPPESWPFADSWWKPSADPVRNLKRAGALIAAEIDRIEREQTRLITNGNQPG